MAPEVCASSSLWDSRTWGLEDLSLVDCLLNWALSLQWFTLDEVPRGKLHLRLEWLTLVADASRLDKVHTGLSSLSLLLLLMKSLELSTLTLAPVPLSEWAWALSSLGALHSYQPAHLLIMVPRATWV